METHFLEKTRLSNLYFSVQVAYLRQYTHSARQYRVLTQKLWS